MRRVNGITHRALSGVLGTPFLPSLAFPSEGRDRWRDAQEHCAAAPAPRVNNARVTSAWIHRAAPARPSRTAHTSLFFSIQRSHPKFRFYSAAKRHEREQTSEPFSLPYPPVHRQPLPHPLTRPHSLSLTHARRKPAKPRPQACDTRQSSSEACTTRPNGNPMLSMFT